MRICTDIVMCSCVLIFCKTQRLGQERRSSSLTDAFSFIGLKADQIRTKTGHGNSYRNQLCVMLFVYRRDDGHLEFETCSDGYVCL
jgi:hypothetical protein